MAQPDNVGRTTSTDAANAPRPQNSPGSKSSRTPTSQGDSSSWSSSSSLKLRKNHDQDEHGSHHKKSVFAKVKEKARKLKKSISGRKRRDDDLCSPNYSTPPGSAGPVKSDKQRPQFFSSPTPLDGTPVSADTKKQSSKEHPQETKKGSSEIGAPSMNKPTPTTDSSPETARDGTKSDVSDPGTSLEAKENNQSSLPPQDKGVSVKEYLMNKLEPGEDERALSQVITQTISPKCEKMKEAVNSLLRTEEAVSKTSNSEPGTTPADSDSNQDIGARSSTESVETKLISMTAHDPSNGPESRLSNVSSKS